MFISDETVVIVFTKFKIKGMNLINTLSITIIYSQSERKDFAREVSTEYTM